MEITITGITGFVGTNIQNYLEASHKIVPMSVRYEFNQRFEIKTSVLIHLAGKAHDLKKVSKPKDYYDANFELTKQLFDAYLSSNATVFVFMSTVKAVADSVDGVLNEDNIADPKTHYGITKHLAEEYILSKKLPDGKKAYILRPCMIHGPGNKGNLNLLYQLVSKGVPWPLGAFKNKRSVLSIENLCFVIENLLENDKIPSGVYHLADDTPLSTNELIELIGISLGKKSKVWDINSSLIKALAKLGDFLYLPLNSERLEKLTENYVVSNKKIIMALGRPLPICSRKGLIETFNSFKKK